MLQKLTRYTSLLLLLSLFFSCQQKHSEKPVKDQPVTAPDWSYDDSIYELNVRQFSKEGTFNAVNERVDELKELGVDIIWIMPIHPIGEKNRKGSLGSYYAVKDFKAINPEFGTLEDFKKLVDTIHQNDMHVILDWVANHTAWDHIWTKSNPEFYTKDSTGNFTPPVEDWSDVIDLNYDNQQMRAEMIEAMRFWVDEADIDGYRCDVAGMVPLDFWKKVRTELDAIKPVFMLAEDEDPEIHEAFNMTYGWEFHHLMNDVAAGNKNANDIWAYLEKDRNRFPDVAFRMNFITNHDENSWNGTIFERLGDGAKAFATLIFTMEGMPLIYSGQEVGMKKRLAFFERDPINWSDPGQYRSFYKKLATLKSSYKALQNGEKGSRMIPVGERNGENVLAFTRKHDGKGIFAVINVSDEHVQHTFTADSQSEGNYTNIITGETVEYSQETSYSIALAPWEFRLLSN